MNVKDFHLKSWLFSFVVLIFIFETLLNKKNFSFSQSGSRFQLTLPKNRPWNASSNKYQGSRNSSNSIFLKVVLSSETTELPFLRQINVTAQEIKGYRERDPLESINIVTNQMKPISATKSKVNIFKENSTSCDNISLLPKGTMPYIVLWSLPGSGNTWLRYLIEHVTGIFTGSVGNDTSLFNGGFRGQFLSARSGRTVVVKTHDFIDAQDADGIVFLIRDPYDSAIAEFNRRVGKGHISLASEDKFKSPEWREFVVKHVQKWAGNIESCLTLPQKKLILFYEDLQSDLRNQLERIVTFLGLPSDEQKLQCTLEHREGNFHRPKRKLSFDPFKKPVKLIFNESIRYARQVMLEYNMTVMKSYERR